MIGYTKKEFVADLLSTSTSRSGAPISVNRSCADIEEHIIASYWPVNERQWVFRLVRRADRLRLT